MFGILMTPKQIEMKEKQDMDRVSRMLEKVEDYHPKIKWREDLALRASTWIEHKLFDLETNMNTPSKLLDGPHIMSPDKRLVYSHLRWPKGTEIDCLCGSRRGTVVFDDDVVTTCLHRVDLTGKLDTNPWMSITPHEVLTLRAGEKYATEHTVIAGLGLGWQLVQVSKLKRVKRITLVEFNQVLVDWLLPSIREKMGPCELEVIVGDAEKIVPTLTAGTALVDIFPSYGGNWFRPKCPNIKHVWCWGAAALGDSSYFW